MRVIAQKPGFYNNVYWRVGDVFDLNSPADFADFNVDPVNGWMLQSSESNYADVATPEVPPPPDVPSQAQ
jgi:hypothetical protein